MAGKKKKETERTLWFKKELETLYCEDSREAKEGETEEKPNVKLPLLPWVVKYAYISKCVS